MENLVYKYEEGCLLGAINTQYVIELLYPSSKYICMKCSNISTVIAGNEQGPPHIFAAYVSIAVGALSSSLCILYII